MDEQEKFFDAVLVGGSGPTGKYKAFAKTKAAFQDPAGKSWAQGSAVVCLNLDTDTTGQSPTVHVKLPEGGWSGIQEEAENNG